jgi:hypothetical protein
VPPRVQQRISRIFGCHQRLHQTHCVAGIVRIVPHEELTQFNGPQRISNGHFRISHLLQGRLVFTAQSRAFGIQPFLELGLVR